MIDNIVPCLKQSEVDLSSKLLQLFERRKVKDEDIRWRKFYNFSINFVYFSFSTSRFFNENESLKCI